MKTSQLLKSKIGAFLIIIPFIKPASEITGAFDIMFDLWKMLAAIIIFCFCCSKRKWQVPLLSLIAIQIIYFISTIIHMGEVSAALVQMVSNMAICLYFDYLFNYDELIAVRNFCYPTMFMATLTAVTMFLYFPTGMYQIEGRDYIESSNYLWGFDNTSGLLFISTMFFMIIYSMYINKKEVFLCMGFLLFFYCLAFLYVDSKTAFLMMFVSAFSYILIITFKLKPNIFDTKIFNIKLAISAVVSGFLVFFLFNGRMTFMWNYARRVGKFFSLRARFIFWEKEFEYFLKSPIIGYGLEDKSLLISKIYIDHPHNFFTDVMYRGGIVGIFMLVIFFLTFFEGKIIKDKMTAITSVCLGTLLVLVMMDFYNEVYLFYPHLYLTYLLVKKRKYRY